MSHHFLVARFIGLVGTFLARRGCAGSAFGSAPGVLDLALLLMGAILGLLLFAGTGE